MDHGHLETAAGNKGEVGQVVDLLYWVLEYGKVLFGYMFLIFLWPSVVFHGYLKNKTRSWRFSFCVTVPIVIINTVVLMMGLIHVLDFAVVKLIFYGVFVGAFLKNAAVCMDSEYRKAGFDKFPNVSVLFSKYGFVISVCAFALSYLIYLKRAVNYLFPRYIEKVKACDRKYVVMRMKNSVHDIIIPEIKRYGLLGAVVIYGMVYFSYGAFQVHSYGYGDLYIHHEWIYGLVEGKEFAGGVYPEAMHCFIYCIHTLFGVRIFSILLFMQGIHVAVFLISGYLLLRKVFHWRYTPVLVLMLFLSLDLNNADSIHNMFRLQITMPMEFGLHTVFLSALYLTKYLYNDHAGTGEKKDLFLFAASLSACTVIHFHVLIMLLLACLSFAIFAWKKIFCRKYLIPLITAGSCAVFIAVLPMAGALMKGIPLNGSIDWAISSMDGCDSREFRGRKENLSEDRENDELLQENESSRMSVTVSVLRSMMEIYEEGYRALYGAGRAGWIFHMTIIAAVFCLLIRGSARFAFLREVSSGYPAVIMLSVLYVLVYAAPMIGLPDMIPEGRFFAIGHMMILSVMAMPGDVIFSMLARLCNDAFVWGASIVSILGIYAITTVTDSFRGYLFYELTRYNSAVAVTNSIIDTYPQYSYTIVSPTDELYQVIQYGWHEELLSFVEKGNAAEYSIPSEYVFIYVEKKPLYYAQMHFFDGPEWLAAEKYLHPYWDAYSFKYPDHVASQSPEIVSSQISEAAYDKEGLEYENPWTMYSEPHNRMILESGIYDWCQRFAKRYPSVLDVYFEDDSFVCYYFRQDVNNGLYNLGTDDSGIYEKSGGI